MENIKRKIVLDKMKWFSLCAFLLIASGATAQEFSKWAVTPRVGMNVSNLVGYNAPGKDSKLGFVGGVDVEYRPVMYLGISLGCYYYTQNSKLHITRMFREYNKHIDDNIHALEMENVSFPLLLNAHVWNGLTVKAGVQFVHWTRSRQKYDSEGYYVELPFDTGQIPSEWLENGVPDGVGERIPVSESSSEKSQNMHNSLTMPIAVAYEYKNVELEVGYNIGSVKLSDSHGCGNHHPKSLVLTLGYKFGL